MEKKRVITYLILAYGLTYLMGLLMWYGAGRGYDLAVFPSAQMMYPAAGVILGILITNKKEKRLPMGFFITTLIVTGILVLLSIISVISPLDKLEIPGAGSIGVYNLISQYVLILGSIVAFILMLVAGKEKRAAVGLTRRNWGKSAWVVALFVIIYLVRTVVSVAISGTLMEWLAMYKNPMIWASVIALPINYFFVFLAFFGEEYGWRYYLQPLLQKKFGLRIGVLVLGVVWGLWHIPIDLFYYTKTSGLQMIFAQQITCIFLGIFLAYAYMKTQNVWVPVCIHYLNNNLVPIITGTLTADVLENQEVKWGDLPIALLINGLCFGFFLLSGVFREKKTIGKEGKKLAAIELSQGTSDKAGTEPDGIRETGRGVQTDNQPD